MDTTSSHRAIKGGHIYGTGQQKENTRRNEFFRVFFSLSKKEEDMKKHFTNIFKCISARLALCGCTVVQNKDYEKYCILNQSWPAIQNFRHTESLVGKTKKVSGIVQPEISTQMSPA